MTTPYGQKIVTVTAVVVAAAAIGMAAAVAVNLVMRCGMPAGATVFATH